jgi:hypothetical protein
MGTGVGAYAQDRAYFLSTRGFPRYWRKALSEEQIKLMRNRFQVPKHLQASLHDADENLRIVHDCGLRHVHYLVYSNGALGLSVTPIFNVAAYVRAHFEPEP